jgi:hypothetical protein
MKLTITVSQEFSGKTLSESCEIELDNMKTNPELHILERIQHLKMIVMKGCDNYLTELLDERETSGELFKRIIKDE